MGRARSLMVATVLGFVGAAGLVCLALWMRSIWSLLIAGYLLLNCWGGLQSARALIRMEKLPRREGFACPSCGAKPPMGAIGDAPSASRHSTHSRAGRFVRIAERNFPTRCAWSANRCIRSASGLPELTLVMVQQAVDRWRIGAEVRTPGLRTSGERAACCWSGKSPTFASI